MEGAALAVPSEGLHVTGLLDARPGDRVRLVGADAGSLSAVLLGLALPREPGLVAVDGQDCGAVPPDVRRRLVGVATDATPLERGTVGRAVRYRRPDAGAATTRAALEAVGLTAILAGLPKGEREVLRGGTGPLTPAESRTPPEPG